MLIIGLTGGIGSGKTAASDLFHKKGITVVDADICARLVVEPNSPALNQIADHFGKDIITEGSKQLDRPKLREIIFDDKEKKVWLEKLLHPLIGEEINRQLSSAKSPYTILSSPLLLETQQKLLCDRILVIDAPVEVQIERACKRDKSSEETIKSIIASQIPRKKRIALADDIIDNSQGFDELSIAVDNLHDYYLSGDFT